MSPPPGDDLPSFHSEAAIRRAAERVGGQMLEGKSHYMGPDTGGVRQQGLGLRLKGFRGPIVFDLFTGSAVCADAGAMNDGWYAWEQFAEAYRDEVTKEKAT